MRVSAQRPDLRKAPGDGGLSALRRGTPRSGRRDLLFTLLLAGGVAAATFAAVVLAEWLAGRKIAATPDFTEMREVLAGRKPEGTASATGSIIPLPYLLFGCAPDFPSRQHNAHGYRGPIVPVRRSPDIARVLFLGGSTTYGWGVTDWNDTCAAIVGARLLIDPPGGRLGAEVINAGVPNATSAELFTHYAFKYRYYAPDLVVIQTGGNDARVMEKPFYSPDYAHERMTPETPAPLPPEFRILLRSNIASLFLLRMMPGGGAGRERFRARERRTPAPVDWFAKVREARPDPGEVPDADDAFRANMLSLIREIQADGAKVALVPFQHQPYDKWPELARLTARTEAGLRRIADETGAEWIDFPYERMPEGGWSDICHTTRIGNEFKADFIAPVARGLLSR